MWWIEDGKQRHSAKYRAFSTRLERDSWKRERKREGERERNVGSALVSFASFEDVIAF